MQRTPPLTLDTTRLAADGPFHCCYGDCEAPATASVLSTGATWQVTTAPQYDRDQHALPFEFCAAHAAVVTDNRNSAAQRFRAGAKIDGPSMSDRTLPPTKGRKGVAIPAPTREGETQ